MTSILDIKAYTLKKFFNFLGRLGGLVLNFGVAKHLDISRDLPYGPDPEQRLDIFKPRVSEGKGLPIVVYFHGGGWISADKRIYDGICAVLSRYGFLMFNVNYRLAPGSRFPAQLQDAAQAIEWTHSNAVRYGGDPSKIVLAGDSAGAQIAAWYASALHKRVLFPPAGIISRLPANCVRGLLLFYGVYDFDTVLDAPFPFIKIYAKSFLGADQKEYAANSALASPVKHVTHHLPAVFLCAGQSDGLYAQTVAYLEVLEKSGISCKAVLLSRADRAGHGFLFFRWRRASRIVFAAVGEYLRGLK